MRRCTGELWGKSLVRLHVNGTRTKRRGPRDEKETLGPSEARAATLDYAFHLHVQNVLGRDLGHHGSGAISAVGAFGGTTALRVSLVLL